MSRGVAVACSLSFAYPLLKGKSQSIDYLLSDDLLLKMLLFSSVQLFSSTANLLPVYCCYAAYFLLSFDKKCLKRRMFYVSLCSVGLVELFSNRFSLCFCVSFFYIYYNSPQFACLAMKSALLVKSYYVDDDHYYEAREWRERKKKY